LTSPEAADIAAEKITPEAINFMAVHGRGLVCLAMTGERLDHLRIGMMSVENTSQFGTAFCEAIDAREGVTTGISAADRSHTIQVAIAPDAKRGMVKLTPEQQMQFVHAHPAVFEPAAGARQSQRFLEAPAGSLEIALQPPEDERDRTRRDSPLAIAENEVRIDMRRKRIVEADVAAIRRIGSEVVADSVRAGATISVPLRPGQSLKFAYSDGVTEANKLEIPVVGTGDTNVDPDELDYIIPANDDAIRAIRLITGKIADARVYDDVEGPVE
jgi:hypothetical protein